MLSGRRSTKNRKKMKCHPPSATNTTYYCSTKNKDDILANRNVVELNHVIKKEMWGEVSVRKTRNIKIT